MKNLSVKLKLSLWVSLLLFILGIIYIIFLGITSERVSRQSSIDTLVLAVRDNLGRMEAGSGSIPSFHEDFVFSHGGISTVIYSDKGALLAGAPPYNYHISTEFINGLVRLVEDERESFMILDLYYPLDTHRGVWVRGIMEAPDTHGTVHAMLKASLVLIPLFLLLSLFGSYLIAHISFRPLSAIIKKTETIREGDDLSARLEEDGNNNEFSRLSRTINAMFQRLEDSFQARKQFTADASHELRTPISIIKSACECSESYDETAEEYQSSMEIIHRQANHMTVLVSELLELSRLDRDFMERVFAPADMNEIAQLCCNEAAEGNYGHESRDITVIFLPPASEPVMVNADTTLIVRLISNLISNGIKYGNAGGHVWVSTGIAGAEAYVSVKDDGPGIPKEIQSRIWERFYQADTPRGEHRDGVGLGLAFVQRIAKLHHGRMELESTAGIGSTFTFYMPALKESP